MFKLEKTYDIDELVRHNMHTHSTFSTWSKPEMVFEDMVAAADRFGLKTLAITDHSDVGDGICTVANYRKMKKRLARLDPNVRVLIGAELSCYGIGKFSEPYRIDRELDYRNYSCNHYHLDFWAQPENCSPRGYALHMLEILNGLFKTDRADAIAHPFNPKHIKLLSPDDRAKVPGCITDSELGDIMLSGEAAGVSWEIHTGSFLSFPDFYRRFFNIGRECGVHFCVGTDAHTIASLDPSQFAPQLKEICR